MYSIKALLLAAGLGTRLKPYTLEKPKCLIEINGEPILGRWIKTLGSIGCNSCLINTHYLANQVENYCRALPIQEMQVETCYEKNLLGTAGTLIANQKFFDSTLGIMLHADNFTNICLDELIVAHLNRPSVCLLTMLTFTTDDPQSCGIVKTNEKGVVTEFFEKVKNPPGNQANGAVYVFDNDLFSEIKNINPEASDFSSEILPKLVGKIYAWHTDEPYIDIGTPERLQEARAFAMRCGNL